MWLKMMTALPTEQFTIVSMFVSMMRLNLCRIRVSMLIMIMMLRTAARTVVSVNPYLNWVVTQTSRLTLMKISVSKLPLVSLPLIRGLMKLSCAMSIGPLVACIVLRTVLVAWEVPARFGLSCRCMMTLPRALKARMIGPLQLVVVSPRWIRLILVVRLNPSLISALLAKLRLKPRLWNVTVVTEMVISMVIAISVVWCYDTKLTCAPQGTSLKKCMVESWLDGDCCESVVVVAD